MNPEKKPTDFKKKKPPIFDYICKNCGPLKNLNKIKQRKNYPFGRKSKPTIYIVHSCGGNVSKIKKGKRT